MKIKVSDDQLKDIKLIITDLDGTLLNKKGKVTDNIKEALKILSKKGVKTTLASGRLYNSMLTIAESLNIDLPLISLDGALIKNRNGSFTLYMASLRPNFVRKAVNLAEQNLVQIGLCSQDEIYYTEESSTLPMILDKNGSNYKKVEIKDEYLENILEIIMASDNKKNLEKIARKLSFPYSFFTSVNIYRSLTYSNIFYLECKKSTSSKSNAFYKLLKYLKIKEKNTLVAGDWYNDIPIFETKAIKVALKNSILKLKQKADIIVNKTNDEEGLLEVFEKIISLKN